jgi:hypothetical protein
MGRVFLRATRISPRYIQGMEALKIVWLSIAAAVAYGIVHDQITARICIEYFTVFHPHTIDSDSPTMQGLVWGVKATWWVGAGLGIPLALVARLGSWPKKRARDLARPLLLLMAASAIVALCAGLIGAALASAGVIWVHPRWADLIPREHHIGFLAAGWAHAASYLSGGMGGTMLIFATYFSRARMARAAGHVAEKVEVA